MALINTLRKRMGKIVVGVVAFSMFAFILTDLFQSNSALLGGQDRDIAEISGKEISYETFNERVDQLATTFALNYNQSPSSDDMTNIRKEAWNGLILDHAYEQQFNELGVQVTDAELVDMVQGSNISPQIRQFFTDPNTGRFSKDAIVGFLQNMGQQDPRQRQSWYSFESTLKPTRKIQKYAALFNKTDYVTQLEAKAHYTSQNSVMTVDYAYVPFFAVVDSLLSVSDSEMQDYLDDHASEYKTEESRSINYVVFPIKPSADDSAYVREEIQRLKTGLVNAQNDSVYATINSDLQQSFVSLSDPELIPAALKADGKVLEPGTVTDPVLEGNTFAIYKLSDITEGGEYFVKASHILIKPEDNSASAKADAKKKTQDLIGQLRRGADFAALAVVNSEDRSNSGKGGDLGWFGENGNFVQEFKDAAFDFKGTGIIPQPVETSFGYHIIKIDEPKTNIVYKVAQINKELFASDATLNNTFTQADILASESGSAKALAENAKTQGLSIKTAPNVGKNESRVGTLTNARQIVSWLYNKGSKGAVSEVFELDGSYVVAGVIGVQEEGTANLNQVEGEVRVKVLNQKKADYIIKKLNEIGADDFDALTEGYGKGARSGSADLSLSSNSFPNVGFSPKAVGVAFSLSEGEKTAPFAIENGVIVLSAATKSTPEELDNYSPYVAQVQSNRGGRRTVIANFPLAFFPVFISENVDSAIKDAAEIEDKRYKFY